MGGNKHEFLSYYKTRFLQNVVYAMFVVFAIVISYKYGFSPERGAGSNAPEAKSGELIITADDIKKADLFQLKGEFSFYWQKLYTQNTIDSLANSPVYVHVPSVWGNQGIYSKNIKPQGYATYHLVVRVPNDAMYGIRVKEMDCAYHLMVNGESVKAGTVGKDKENTIPSWKREEVFFYSKNNKIDIVLQIANFHHRKGGPEDVMLFGTARNIRAYKIRQMIISMFLLGVFFALTGYFFHVYIVGRRDKSIAIFSLLSFFALLRLATTGEKLLLELFPNLSWDLAIRIEYLAFIVIVGLFYSFLRTFYVHIFAKAVERFIWTVILMSCFPVVFMSPMLFSYIPIYYQVFALAVGCYMIYGILVALIKRLEFSGVFMVGLVFFYGFLINDILYYNKIINAGFLLPYGIFLLYFSFSFVMAKKLTYAFLDVDRLSSALKKQTQYLESEVSNRTKEIRFQKESIEKQAQSLKTANAKLIELNRFKDDMTGMIVHDLKNPLNSIISLAHMNEIPDKDKLIWQAGIEMHNMVLNILDVNKAEEVGFSVKKERLNFNQIITDAIHDVSVNVLLKKICIERSKSCSLIVNGDAEILKRVLINILINAIRFSPAKGKIVVELDQLGNDYLLCKIQDQGPGIKSDMLQKIFDRYTSGDQTDPSLRSTGLGLAFCKMAIEAHDGTIGVSSVWGEGSEFEIKLPLN